MQHSRLWPWSREPRWPFPPAASCHAGKAVVVLPGFPTSAIFTFHEFVAPVIRALAGRASHEEARLSARLPFRVASESGRTEYVLALRDRTGLWVAPNRA